MIGESLAYDDFIKFYTNLTGREYTDKFYLFGRTFYIHIKKELIRILNLSLMAYYASNRNDLIEEEFKNLYFSIYEDTFAIEIQTTMENFDAV